MATLHYPDSGLTVREPNQVQRHLEQIGIEYERWELQELPQDATNEQTLAAYAERIEAEKQRGAYTAVDFVNVNPATPGLDSMLARFSQEHWHDEDEVRFTLEGRGIFHIHPNEQVVVVAEVGPGDMIRVPRGTLHWFNLCEDRRIKTIRFFQDPSGWTPHYTVSGLDAKYQPVCFGPQIIPPGVNLQVG
jgi:1,2-dihydroxy-3-keto-5-methylthiopentene dioxygenase